MKFLQYSTFGSPNMHPSPSNDWARLKSVKNPNYSSSFASPPSLPPACRFCVLRSGRTSPNWFSQTFSPDQTLTNDQWFAQSFCLVPLLPTAGRRLLDCWWTSGSKVQEITQLHFLWSALLVVAVASWPVFDVRSSMWNVPAHAPIIPCAFPGTLGGDHQCQPFT